MPDLALVNDFMAQRRFALVGISRNPKAFANIAFHEMRAAGYEVVPVAAHATEVGGARCYRSITEVRDALDGVMVVVNAESAKQVVHEAVDAGVPRVSLHRGPGQGAVSDEAVEYCRAHGVSVVDGACALMFTQHPAFIHRAHRGVMRLTGSSARRWPRPERLAALALAGQRFSGGAIPSVIRAMSCSSSRR